MTPETYPTPVINPDGSILQAEIQAWEESPSDEDSVLVKLILTDSILESQADDFFSALTEIRKSLEKSGRLLGNYGSSLQVYPSPMSRNMGSGGKAYKLVMGKQAMTSDLVSIFESGPDVHPSKVEDQENHYAEWLKSLKK
jgi:hypothetical protein